MSLTVANNDLLSMKLLFQASGSQTGMNILHYQIGSLAGAPPTVEAFLARAALAVYDGFKDVWRVIPAVDVTFSSVTGYSVFPLPRSLGITYSPGTPTTGTEPGQSLPLQDSVTILKQTRLGNRHGIGRMFFNGIAESRASNGTVDVITGTDIAPMVAQVAASISVSDAGWSAIISPVLIQGPEDNPVQIQRIVSSRLSDRTVKTQRRRRPGKGI